MIKVHPFVLIACSTIGFTGHYLQFGVARITPWIPATIGLIVMMLNHYFGQRKDWTRHLPVIILMTFGLITTNMCIRFLPQDFQPLRKKIIFSTMSLSAWITFIQYLQAIWHAPQVQGRK